MKTDSGDLISSKKHKWFVYDTVKDSFYFETTGNIDIQKHKLVKNYLAFLDTIVEVSNIRQYMDMEPGQEISITFSDNTELVSTYKQNICVYDKELLEFIMIMTIDLQIGMTVAKINL